MPTPPKPARFAPDAAPPGVEYRHVEFIRPKLRAPARILLIHTNGARGEGSIESAWNWAHSAPNQRTCPTYQVDLGGGARKMLRSDEDAIANCTVNDYQNGHGDVSEWSLAIETADTGTDDDPTISAFTPAQIETIATIVAYESMVPGAEIPLVTPTEWYGSGVAGHTDPFGYPLWTCVRGKICPGDKKKAQVRSLILPRAREIVAAWTAPTPPPPPLTEDDMPKRYLARLDTNKYHYRRGYPGLGAEVLRSPEYHALKTRFDTGIHPGPATVRYYNPHTDELITAWEDIPVLTETQLNLDVGYLSRHSQSDEG